jgi:hypothetical protein
MSSLVFVEEFDQFVLPKCGVPAGCVALAQASGQLLSCKYRPETESGGGKSEASASVSLPRL